MDTITPQDRVGTRDEWTAARLELLQREKQLNRLRDELAVQRRRLPWVRVDEDYRFQGADGARSLHDLFGGRGQLIVYHFMFGPDWDEGCPSCSFWADSFDGVLVHLAHRDTTLVAVSRAPYDLLAAYRQRMGWHFPVVLVRRQQLQHRLRGVVHARAAGRRCRRTTSCPWTTRPTSSPASAPLPPTVWRRLPHLLDLRPWPRPHEQRVPAARPDGPRPRRGRPAALHGLAASPRRVRRLTGRSSARRRGLARRCQPDERWRKPPSAVADCGP